MHSHWALGNQAKATGAWSIAIAQDTEASGHLSLAASYGAKTAGLQSVGIGVLAATSSAAENLGSYRHNGAGVGRKLQRLLVLRQKVQG